MFVIFVIDLSLFHQILNDIEGFTKLQVKEVLIKDGTKRQSTILIELLMLQVQVVVMVVEVVVEVQVQVEVVVVS